MLDNEQKLGLTGRFRHRTNDYGALILQVEYRYERKFNAWRRAGGEIEVGWRDAKTEDLADPALRSLYQNNG